MKVSVLNMTGDEIGTVELPASIFETRINRDLMHQALVRHMANSRRGTHSAKTRAEVNRTGAKWYRQKGTGRARHGSKRAPIFVGGGVAHGPKPRSYSKNMPRKMRRNAIRSALTVKASSGDIIVLDELTMERPKTKDMAEMLSRVTDNPSTLVLTAEQDDNVERSTRNMPEAKALQATYLNIRDILGHQKLVMPLSALQVIQGFLAKEETSVISEIGDLDGEEE